MGYALEHQEESHAASYAELLDKYKKNNVNLEKKHNKCVDQKEDIVRLQEEIRSLTESLLALTPFKAKCVDMEAIVRTKDEEILELFQSLSTERAVSARIGLEVKELLIAQEEMVSQFEQDRQYTEEADSRGREETLMVTENMLSKQLIFFENLLAESSECRKREAEAGKCTLVGLEVQLFLCVVVCVCRQGVVHYEA